MCVAGGKLKKKKNQKAKKKKAGSDSLEIVFDLAELSHLHTEVSRPREMSRFLEVTKRSHHSPGVVITGNYNPHYHSLEEPVHILTD